MSAINFPNSPALGDVFLDYRWDGVKWIKIRPADVKLVDILPATPDMNTLYALPSDEAPGSTMNLEILHAGLALYI